MNSMAASSLSSACFRGSLASFQARWKVPTPNMSAPLKQKVCQ